MQSKPTPSGVDRFSASLNASALPWASGLGKLTTTPTRSSRAGVSRLACFQKQLFAMWMWRMYWISLHTLIDSRLFAWDVSADHQPLSARPHQPGREHLGEPIATEGRYRTFQFRLSKEISYRTSNIEYLLYWKNVISLCFLPRAHSLTQNLGLLLLLKCRSCSLGGYESPWAPGGAIFIPGEIMTRREYWKPFFSQLNQF